MPMPNQVETPEIKEANTQKIHAVFDDTNRLIGYTVNGEGEEIFSRQDLDNSSVQDPHVNSRYLWQPNWRIGEEPLNSELLLIANNFDEEVKSTFELRTSNSIQAKSRRFFSRIEQEEANNETVGHYHRLAIPEITRRYSRVLNPLLHKLTLEEIKRVVDEGDLAKGFQLIREENYRFNYGYENEAKDTSILRPILIIKELLTKYSSFIYGKNDKDFLLRTQMDLYKEINRILTKSKVIGGEEKRNLEKARQSILRINSLINEAINNGQWNEKDHVLRTQITKTIMRNHQIYGEISLEQAHNLIDLFALLEYLPSPIRIELVSLFFNPAQDTPHNCEQKRQDIIDFIEINNPGEKYLLESEKLQLFKALGLDKYWGPAKKQ
jgi:hypothetical protein